MRVFGRGKQRQRQRSGNVSTIEASSTKLTLTHCAQLLACIAPLFTRLSGADYSLLVSSDQWSRLLSTADELAHDAQERDQWAQALEPLTGYEYATFSGELFVPGLPFALMPVESLYRPWSQAAGNQFGATRGLYMGDSAQHMADLYAALDIEVPEQFAAMPDHLSLELEFLALLLEAGNLQGAREFVADHLAWLGDYDAALANRTAAVRANRTLPGWRRAALLRGMEAVRTLVALVDRVTKSQFNA